MGIKAKGRKEDDFTDVRLTRLTSLWGDGISFIWQKEGGFDCEKNDD
jgi:hypothetical protein